MRRISLFIFICLLVGCASSSKHPPGRDAYDPYLMVQDSLAKIPLVPVGNHQWQVSAEVNGITGIFAVDTGSATTILSPQFASKIGLPKGRLAKVIYVKLGGLLYVNFFAPILKLDRLNRATHTKFDGILGNNVLSKTACTLDWRNHLLTLNADAIARPTNAVFITTQSYRTYLKVSVNGQPLDFALDTGAYSSSITGTDVRRLRIPREKKSQILMPRADIAGVSPLEETQVTLDAFKVAQISRTNFPLLTWRANVIGMDLLEPWTITYDAPAGWLSFSEPDSSLK